MLWSHTQKRWYTWPGSILVADRHTVSNAPDCCSTSTAQTVLRVLSAFANVTTTALPSVGGGTGERESPVRLVPILVADGHTVYGTVASCIPEDQRSPAPPVTTKLLLFVPCTCKAACFKVEQARVLPCLGPLYRSHFGSRYKWGCCCHAGLFRKRPASICHIASLMTNTSPARTVTSTLLLFAPCTCM